MIDPQIPMRLGAEADEVRAENAALRDQLAAVQSKLNAEYTRGRADGWEAAMLKVAEQVEALAAALAVKDEALTALTNKGRVPPTANTFHRARAALAIQPHASLVAKIKADAVRKARNGNAE